MAEITVELIREYLEERIPHAREEANESHQAAMNSFGAGYDRGYLDALGEVLRMVNGEDNP